MSDVDIQILVCIHAFAVSSLHVDDLGSFSIEKNVFNA